MPAPLWMEKLRRRWNVNSAWQVVIILVVFACTGFTVLGLKKPVLNLILGEGNESGIAKVLYYIFILPVYNIILLAYGFIFGQFNFFWTFEKRSFNRIFGRSKKNL